MPRICSPPSQDLWTVRLLCLLGGLAVPLYSVALADGASAPADPIWIRWALGSVAVSLAGASLFIDRVRSELSGLSVVLLQVYVAWYLAIAWTGDLAPSHAVLGLCLLVAAGVIASSLHGSIWKGSAVIGVNAAALLALAALIESPHTDRLAFAAAVVGTSLVLIAAEWMHTRLRSQLQSTSARLETLFDQVGDGVLLVDAKRLSVIASNDAFRQITGFESQTLRTLTLYDLTGLRPDEVDRDLQQAVEQGTVDLGDRRYKRQDGSPFHAHVTLSMIDDPKQDLFCLTIKDLSDQKEARAQIAIARDQAQAMSELRTIFLNNMSHELRTPLVSLTGFLDLLQDEQAVMDPTERTDMIRSLRRSAERLNQTLNAVLDLAQIESGHIDLQPELVEANRAAREAFSLLAPFAREKGLRLTFKESEHADVLVDRTALHRILLNLLSNAVKFTPAGEIGVEVEADSHRVMIHIRDTGVGIKPEFVPYLFGAFRQASAGHGREHEGCGLGLTITKRLMDLVGGRIRVDSTLDEGTCVSVLFGRAFANAPLAFAAPAGDGAAGPEPVAPTSLQAVARVAPLANHARALIVEDNADTARLMERMLRDVFEVEVATDGRTAMQLARAKWFDVLVMDINLGPGMDGTTLLARLRKMSAYAHVPAIAVTTFTSPGDRERFLAMGFDAYLPKPFTRKQLLATTQSAYASRALAAA